LAPGTEGGWTTDFLDDQVKSIYDASMHYQVEGIPLVVIGGSDYGMGSSRDWAAKGPFLLGVKAVLAKSLERIHRSNLVMMGVLPLVFAEGEDAAGLGLDGSEIYDIPLTDSLRPRQEITVTATANDGSAKSFKVIARVDTDIEVEYLRNGGILHYVLRRMAAD
jgi:aconitate hydratase